MGEFEELMRLAAQHTREVDKELERKRKRQQLEEERKKKEQERKRQEEKAITAAQLAEMRKRDLMLEREREERKRERERELLREKLEKEKTKEHEAKSNSYRKEKELPYVPKPPKQKLALSFDELINQASEIPTTSLKLIPTNRRVTGDSRSKSPLNYKESRSDSRRTPGGMESVRGSSVRHRTDINTRDTGMTKSVYRARDGDFKDKRTSISVSNRDPRPDLSMRNSKSTAIRDVRKSISDPDVSSGRDKTSSSIKSKYSDTTKVRHRSLSPPPKSRKKTSISPRRPLGRKPVDDLEFNEDYVKKSSISSIIGQLFGYDRSRYANERYSDDDMEASITDLRKEESRSAKIARLEDEREEELERQEQERLKARKKARLDMERKKNPR